MTQPGPVTRRFLQDVTDRQALTHQRLGWVAPAPPKSPPQATDVQTPSVSKDIPGAVPGKMT